MGEMLPECLEVQFGWAEPYAYPATHASVSRYYPDGSNEFRLRLVRKGAYAFSCNAQECVVHGPSVMLIPPYAPLTTTTTRVLEACAFVCVGFRVLLFGSLDITPELLPRLSIWHPDPTTYEALDALMRVFLPYAHPSTMSASFIRDGLLRAIAGLCWEPLGMQRLTEGRQSQVPKWLTTVLQEIRHYPGVTVTALERLTGYSHTHFHRLFQQHIGVPPRVYLQRHRQDMARRLLSTTDLSIASIADHLGFVDASDFARFFRRTCQMAPSEFRQTTVAADPMRPSAAP